MSCYLHDREAFTEDERTVRVAEDDTGCFVVVSSLVCKIHKTQTNKDELFISFVSSSSFLVFDVASLSLPL